MVVPRASVPRPGHGAQAARRSDADQPRPGTGADGVLGEAFEINTVNVGPDQNAGREQPRRPRLHNAHIALD
jgi:hypothetical protein